MPKQHWEFLPSDRWVRATAGGETVADSKRAMLLIENRRELDYYFPVKDVRMDLLVPSDHTETSGYRGTRRFWHLRAGERIIENAAWNYDRQVDRPDLDGYIAFNWEAMDHWYEEEEEIFLHVRHPYHRVDTIPSSRHVQVFIEGVKVADSNRPFLLFETSLPTRYYLPVEDVDMRYLVPSDSASVCPYKGVAAYFDVRINGEVYRDAVWTYRDPIPESPKIKGLLAFWPEKDSRIEILVDGERPARRR